MFTHVWRFQKEEKTKLEENKNGILCGVNTLEKNK